MQKLSYKQLGNDINEVLLNTLFTTIDKITDWKLSINLSDADVKLHNGGTPSTLQKEESKLIFILDDFTSKEIVGIAYVTSYTDPLYTIKPVKFGSNNGGIYRALDDLDETILKSTVLSFLDIDTTLSINQIEVNQLVYDENGTVGIITNINELGNEVTIVTITTSGSGSNLQYYKYDKKLNKKIDTTQLITFADLDTKLTINDIKKDQLVYDEEGTVAKIENIDTVNGEVNLRIITIDTVPTSIKEYKVTDTLDIAIDSQQLINIPAAIKNDVKIDQLVYDNDGTVAKIINIDTTQNKMMVQTITGLGMPTSPDHKEPKIRKGGTGYSLNETIATTTSGVFVKITKIDANGAILEVLHDPTATSVSTTNGKDAQIDYEQVIYGGYGKNWYQLSDAAVLVAQTIAEGFTFEKGYEYEIVAAGSGYSMGNVLATDVPNQFVKVTQIDTAGEILAVVYTRKDTVNVTGIGATIKATQSDNVFIIPDDRWNIGTALFTITNDDGASVQFLRTDNVLTKYNAGNGTIYKFTFDNVEGSIIQEKTPISGSGVLYVTTLPTNATTMKKDILYVSEEGYCITTDNITLHTSDFSNELKEYSSFKAKDIIKKGTTITKDKILYRVTSDITVSAWSTDKSKLEEIKTDSAIIGGFVPNKYYAENETIIDSNLVYTRITAGVSGASLGADIGNWKLVTKLHSSGNRYVKVPVTKGQALNNTWSLLTFDSPEGDTSMFDASNNSFIAQQSGLYSINLSSIRDTKQAAFLKEMYVEKNDTHTICSVQTTSGQFPNISAITYLEKDDYIKVYRYSSTSSSVSANDKTYMEFTLLSEDKSDNLIAEAELTKFTTKVPTVFSDLQVTNSTNPSIIETGKITLPEDGSYIVSIDSLTASAANPLTSGDGIVRIVKDNIPIAVSKIMEISSTVIPSLTYILSGSKGTEFKLELRGSVARTLTWDNTTHKIRIFKIKSVQQTLTSKDLYADYLEDHKNDINVMTYDEWVTRKYNDSNLTVVGTIDANQSLVSNLIPLNITYSSGEIGIIDGNKMIAPISGYYSIVTDPIAINDSGTLTMVLAKNNNTASWDDAISFAEIESNNWIPTITKEIWLDKGDYVTLKARIKNKTADILPVGATTSKVTMTLLHTGSPDVDINYPNTWTPNTEVYLGNNLYGYRATGDFTSAAGIGASQATTVTNVENIINQGGSAVVNSMRLPNVSYTVDAANSTCGETVFYVNNLTTNNLTLYSVYNKARTNDPYDVWCTYTKN